MKNLIEFKDSEVNKTKMDQLRGGKTVAYYSTSDQGTYWDYNITYTDGSTQTKYLEK